MNSAQFISNAHLHSKGKVCGKCKEHLPLSEFVKDKNRKDGLRWGCKSCSKGYQDNVCRFKFWFQGKKSDAKRNGVEFTIEPTDIPGVKIEWYNTRKQGSSDTWRGIKYPKVCPVLGIKLDWGMGGRTGGRSKSPSLDRIDSTKGYIKGNVMMISMLANQMKSNATPEQLNQFCRYFLFGETA